jgi:hypothetical protein
MEEWQSLTLTLNRRGYFDRRPAGASIRTPRQYALPSRRAPVAFIVLLLFVGCGPRQVRFDKAARGHIKRLAILQVKGPGPDWDFIHALMNVPCIDPHFLFCSRDYSKSLSTIFQNALAQRGIDFSPLLTTSLREALARKGYEIICLPNEPRRAEERTEYYSKLQVDADAALSVYLSMTGYSLPLYYGLPGYSGRGFTRNIMAWAELVDLHSNKTVYSRRFYIGPLPMRNVDWVCLNAGYEYESFELLMQNFNGAVRGLNECHSEIAARIAEELG